MLALLTRLGRRLERQAGDRFEMGDAGRVKRKEGAIGQRDERESGSGRRRKRKGRKGMGGKRGEG